MFQPVAREPASPDKALAGILRLRRNERDDSQEEIAYHAGITAGTLARIELGHADPRWTTVRRIAGALGISLVELAAAVEEEEAGEKSPA